MLQLFYPPLLVGFILSLASLLGPQPLACWADAPMPAVVEIVSASGRTFRGRISPATDSTALHLETTQGTIRVTRPISWDAIAQVDINSQRATLKELATLAVELKQAEPQSKTPGVLYLGPSADARNAPPENALLGYEEPIADASNDSSVAYLSASAQYGNWDADAAVDGLEVIFTPMDASGRPVLVDGHLEAELYAFRMQSFHHVPHGLGARFERISTWRIPLDDTHARYDARVARLPYQGASPAEEGRIVPHGLLVLRLVVPGQGTFSTSLDDVRLRPYSAVRDANELRGNPRYVPGENPRYLPYRTP